ncbi:hypothetical protein SD70_32090 [Gordoniibacillus kamchatkensis]|uniref:DUF2573 domain-containing protein n=1 Tax=Gordoniibacillus kamchatkensis TaxID=1590651 RepID=A0ABR5A3H8_9BACL|nr:DUF2573 family protein [Paenibacillus sp. VKM B-2647]KIL35612.1 hypothetical protein SD70_32090 [Paenibacillus sp. VKM B-2647]
MNPEFTNDFDALVAKLAELTTGDASPEMMEKIKIWAIYNHIHKTMPALASHWGQSHPAARAEVRKLFEEVRDKNRALRKSDGEE